MGLLGNNNPEFWVTRSIYNWAGNFEGHEYVHKTEGSSVNSSFTIYGGYSGAAPYEYSKLYAPMAPEPVSLMHPGQVLDVLSDPSSGYVSGYERQVRYMKFLQGSGFIESGHMLLPGERGSYEWDGQRFYKRKRLAREILLPKTIASNNGTTAPSHILTSNSQYISYLSYPNSATQTWTWNFPMAAGWDKGPIRVYVHWFTPTSTAGTIRWLFDAIAISNGQSYNYGGFSAQKNVSQTLALGDNNKIWKTARTEEFAIRNVNASWHPDYESPFVLFEVRRTPADTDTLEANAYLVDVVVEYYLDKWW